MAIDLLPDNVKVGILTYGTMINVHELYYEFCPRRVVFRGTMDITPAQVEQFLNIKNPAQRFVLPLGECRDTLTQLVEDLHVDLWPVAEHHRPFRMTGICLSLAYSMAHCLQSGLV